jgi:hypothetical protein
MQPLEFRGVLIDEDGEYFRIIERTTKSSFWLGLNETGAPFVVRHYDGRRQVVTVEYQGRVIALPLRRPQMTSKEPTGQRTNSGERPVEQGTPNAVPQPAQAGDTAQVSPVAAPSNGSARREAIREEIDHRAAEKRQP